MKNKVTNNHSYRGNIIYQTKYINKLIEEKKIRQAKLLIEELLDEYPNDNVLIYEWVRILAFEGEYAEAYKQLSVFQEQEKYYHFYLTILAILSENYEAMEYYYYKYFQDDNLPPQTFRENQQTALKIYLQKIFEPEKKVALDECPDRGRDTYYLRQIANYDLDHAYRHIVNSHVLSANPKKTIFAPTIEIKGLLKELKVAIEANKGQSHLLNLQEIYYFHYPHCGKTREQPNYCLDHLVVSTILNTSDILTVYPCRENVIYNPLDLPIKESIDKEKELKRTSQIDKFNMRYGKK